MFSAIIPCSFAWLCYGNNKNNIWRQHQLDFFVLMQWISLKSIYTIFIWVYVCVCVGGYGSKFIKSHFEFQWNVKLHCTSNEIYIKNAYVPKWLLINE